MLLAGNFACDPLVPADEAALYLVMLNESFSRLVGEYGESSQRWPVRLLFFRPVTHPSVSQGGTTELTIVLPDWCRTDPVAARHQLAHESFHVFSGVDDGEATRLEEGFAADWSDRYVNFLRYAPVNGPHAACRDLVAAIHFQNQSALSELRKIEPIVSHVTQAMLREVCPRLADSTIASLVAKF